MEPPAPSPDPTVTTDPSVTTQKLNNAPQISGTPPVAVVVGQPYEFQPVANDPESDKLTFSIVGQPSWATFSTTTGRLAGTPQGVGQSAPITISVSDGRRSSSLAPFTVSVTYMRKASYGHYFATRYDDTPAAAAMLCEQDGVKGVVWRRTWGEVERNPGVYDFSSFDAVLQAISTSKKPDCQLWLFIEFKSFASSPVKNPCPVYLQGQYSAPNAAGNGAMTCFMWDPVVVRAYSAMMKAAGDRYDANPRVEGLIFQESALGFEGVYSQDVADGSTYTPEAWRDGLIELINQCSASFKQSRCMAFLNFLRGRQAYLYNVSDAISAVPDNRACMSGPDLLPANTTLYKDPNRAYEILARHEGCRSNSAQNDSYDDPNCGLECIFKFAVSGTFGDFNETSPMTSGVCVNSYLFWNHRGNRSSTGLNWMDALPVIAANPYGPNWYQQCAGGGGTP